MGFWSLTKRFENHCGPDWDYDPCCPDTNCQPDEFCSPDYECNPRE